MKLLRTIRLDASDTFVFERAADPGEWAVPGAFAFLDADPATLEGKARTAFRSGFLGVASLGWSTLVQVVEASEENRRAAIEMLAARLVAQFGAPDLEAARAAAAEEVAFAASLAPNSTACCSSKSASSSACSTGAVFPIHRPPNGSAPYHRRTSESPAVSAIAR